MKLLERFRDALKEDGGLTDQKVDEAFSVSSESRDPLDRVLLTRGFLTEKQMLRVFSRAMALPLLENLTEATIPAEFVEKVSVQFARGQNLAAIGEADGVFQVATCNPFDFHPLDELALMLGRTILLVLAPKSEITALINKAYQKKMDVVDEMLEDLEDDEMAGLAREMEDGHDLLDMANKAPIIKLVNMIMFQALKMRASDIHLQPYEEKLQVRYRVDGILYDMMTPPKKIQEAVISRIKIMGKMDIAERRLPQDGRATIKVGDNEVDVRISSVPTSHGERIVMRLLDKSARLLDLRELGLDGEQFPIMDKLVRCSHGVLLVTGPTGSGKTTTLYASLKSINSTAKNVLTIEDPVEYQVNGISQIEVSAKKGLTFATGLRSIVRQDPNIIMVGEIRDGETADIAIQSSLTGHLVFSTLHTNDAPGAITRLLDLGVEPYLVASSLVGVVAQRLVRLICKGCKEETEVTEEGLASIGITPDRCPAMQLWKGRGCDRCLGTGYHDRTGIYEILPINDQIRDQVVAKTSSTTIKQEAVRHGLRTLRMDGAIKVLQGRTTIEEVMRVTQMDVV
ncbi:MAG: type II secretion system ATPase GspE [Candidatus Brocadiae bacterium]|nr:type II secretion system ATPase GspE [Candidatus Brocadiia bacterium]